MTHYTNTDNPIDFPKKKNIPILERFAAQSLVEHEGELIFSKEKFAELIVEECRTVVTEVYRNTPLELCGPLLAADEKIANIFYGVEE